MTTTHPAFAPTISDSDLHRFSEGTHRRLWELLGAHVRVIDGTPGTSFAVWAPNARRVSVVGDFCRWDGRVHPMRRLGRSGVFELFVPGVGEGESYKFEILTRDGTVLLKTDPFGRRMEQPPTSASIVVGPDRYRWADDVWMKTGRMADHPRSPMAIYELHLGSWARVHGEDNRFLTYREIAPRIADHARALGFTHVQLMPVLEHPYYGSWGYQVTGYFAPTSRYGTPDDFRYLVDTLHQHGIGVILDWVPAHFPRDDFALRRFDGTALFEPEDPRLGEHPDWGTMIFNYGRDEVRNFLVANALYWLREFHLDGLRVDAVASMLYLDYSRKPGESLRNEHGGNENLEAVRFLMDFNDAVHAEAPGCFTVAEESTSWPGVTRATAEGGLGFDFKWNMGWMHDTLEFFKTEPAHRGRRLDLLTFGMVYEYGERYIMPLSHDEVVHLKKSLLTKMTGNESQRRANLRLLLAYLFTRPGKKLLFMGAELAQAGEWNHEASLDWSLLVDDADRAAHSRFLAVLLHLYQRRPSLWRNDDGPHGFAWIDVADRTNAVISYVRRAEDEETVVVLNLKPVAHDHYRIGVPRLATYDVVLTTDDRQWGGTGYDSPVAMSAEPTPFHGFEQSIVLTLAPLAALVLAPRARP